MKFSESTLARSKSNQVHLDEILGDWVEDRLISAAEAVLLVGSEPSGSIGRVSDSSKLTFAFFRCVFRIKPDFSKLHHSKLSILVADMKLNFTWPVIEEGVGSFAIFAEIAIRSKAWHEVGFFAKTLRQHKGYFLTYSVIDNIEESPGSVLFNVFTTVGIVIGL